MQHDFKWKLLSAEFIQQLLTKDFVSIKWHKLDNITQLMWTFIANLWKQEIQSGNEQSRHYRIYRKLVQTYMGHTGKPDQYSFLSTCEDQKVPILLLICDPMYFVLVFSFR